MIVHQGIYLPDGETHLTQWMDKAGEIVDGKGTYQIGKLRAFISHCRQIRNVVDIGAHCGLWSMQLAKHFGHVYAFEPIAEHRDCWTLNVTAMNASIHPYALGQFEGSVSIRTAPTSSGDSYVDGDGPIPMATLDSFELKDIDGMKLDTEGYELPILRGAVETIKRDMPTIIVEQKPGHAKRFGYNDTDAVPFLQKLGYKVAREMAGDFIMVPK